MVQNSQINKHTTPHKHKQRQKSHDRINRCEKAFDKVQHTFIIKMLSIIYDKKVGVEGAYLKIIKAIHKKSAANIVPGGTM